MDSSIFRKDKTVNNGETIFLGEKAQQALEFLKSDLTFATLRVINENLPFFIETDASENAIPSLKTL